MSGKKILIYSQDVGGAKYIAPVINTIVAKYQVMVIGHPLSESTFQKEKIVFSPLTNFFDKPYPSKYEIETFLIKNKFSHVFCTLSSTYQDLTNAYLIEICGKLKIPTYGVMDHWKGYDRFFDNVGVMAYFPDQIGCIDSFCSEELIKRCKDPARVIVVGHPHLERVFMENPPNPQHEMMFNMLIISQPDTREKSFVGVFLKKNGSGNILDKILEQIKQIDSSVNYRINYRFHPKEKRLMQLPGDIHVDNAKTWEDALFENDIFLGLDSMLLVEAALAGKKCISLLLPEFSDYGNKTIPYRIWENVGDINNLGMILRRTVKSAKHNYSGNLSDLVEAVKGSHERVIKSFEAFIHNYQQLN
jgi:hypothetical protein